MFPLIPYKHFAINTNLSIEDAVSLIASKVHAPPSSLFSIHVKNGFEGSVSNDGFTINRAFHGRNSFLPVINGRFKPINKGTMIDVYITLHPIVLIFSAPIFFSLFGLLFEPLIKDFFSSGGHISTALIDTIGTFGIIYLLFFLIFGFESKKAEKSVREIFERYDQFPDSTKTGQSVIGTAFTICGLAFIAGLIISWYYFGR
jgi:hypothetical protein